MSSRTIFRHAAQALSDVALLGGLILAGLILAGEADSHTSTAIEAGSPTIVKRNKNNVPGTIAGTEMEFVKIPAGTFLMGSHTDEPGRLADETQHRVTLTRDFYMSKYQVTNAQYVAFLNAAGVGGNGKGTVSYTDGSGNPQTNQTHRFIHANSWSVTYDDDAWKVQANYENHPVIRVTWYGAKAFADFYGYSLPTEAQWEYACRGKQHKSLPFGIGDGTKLTYDMANFYTYYPYDVARNGEYYDSSGTGNVGKTTAVGSYPYSNGYGLYDMHGNVLEWCADWYAVNYGSAKANDPVTDPTGPDMGHYRVLRGGCRNSDTQYCRSAHRFSYPPATHNGGGGGFRVSFTGGR